MFRFYQVQVHFGRVFILFPTHPFFLSPDKNGSFTDGPEINARLGDSAELLPAVTRGLAEKHPALTGGFFFWVEMSCRFVRTRRNMKICVRDIEGRRISQ